MVIPLMSPYIPYISLSVVSLLRSTSDSQKTGNQNTSASATNVRQGVRPHPDNYRPRPPSDSKPNQKNGFQISREKVLEKRQAKALSAKLAASGKTVTDFLPHGSEKQAAEREHAHNGARDDASTTVYEPVNTFVCEACDKMYTTQKDLDIHKAFCYELQA